MRFPLLVLTSVLGSAILLGEDRPQPEDSAKRVLSLAREYEFFGDASKTQKFTLEPKPLLTYSNPVRGDVYGNVFVWTHEGRPEVVAAIFDFKSEQKLDSELHTLARGGVVGVRDGQEFWNPLSPGVTFAPLKGAGVPAESPSGRLRQMRDLARKFTVEREHPEQGKETMRLLNQPIHRYASEKNGVVDGGMFVFVEGTDPEAYLLLEAAGGEKPGWRYAFARMNIVDFRARFEGKSMWHVEPVSWDTVFDRHEPYAIVRESPRRGLVRTR